MNSQDHTIQPPQPEDFEDENGDIDWVAYYEAQEEYELQTIGLR